MKEKKVGFWQSIRIKLILLMAALVAVPLIVSIIVSMDNTKSSGIANAKLMNDAQSHVVELSILDVINQNIKTLQAFADAPSTIEYLKADGASKYAEGVLRQMYNVDESLADGNSTIIAGRNGRQMLRTVGDCVDIKDREYYKQAMAGNVYVSDIQVSKSTGERICTFAIPVWDTEHENVLGIVQRNYNLSNFHDLIAEEVTEEKQELVIVDNTGFVIAHSGHEIAPDAPEDQSGNPFYTDSRGTELEGSYETKWAGDTWMVSWVKEPISGWVVASCRVQSVALASVNRMILILAIVGVVFVVIGVVAAIMIANSFTKPLTVINASISSLADGRFERIEKYTGRKDEFGVIVADTNAVIDKLDEIVGDIKNSAQEVNKTSVELADTADQISQTADDVSEAVQEIASGATQQADEIQHATESTGVISDNVQLVTDSAASVAQTATDMESDSRESAAQLDKLKKSSEEMTTSIDQISEKIGATGAAVENISKKVEVINSIASQTNLLALNASIEAARAGEAGRGFAVVAEEIGKLADESAASANEIQAEMNVLLKESQSAIEMAADVNKTTEEQKAIIEDTVNSIAKLIDGIEMSVAGIESITASAQACDESKDVIVDAMSSLSAISEENAAGAEETSASMEELNATVNTLAAAAGSLKDISEKLINEMQFFKA
ncbi:MAG: methyl-accepting chemotaxis protein [Lachnospiraceae bacterium]|nr:methyl-accepting chemotaxis protein [Lachnospiraceae bacterium]